MGNDDISHGAEHSGKEAVRDKADDREDDQGASCQKKVIQEEGIDFIDAEELEDEADEERPAIRVLVVLKPVTGVVAVFEGPVVAHGRPVDAGDILAYVGINVLVIKEAMHLWREKMDGQKGGDEEGNNQPGALPGKPLPGLAFEALSEIVTTEILHGRPSVEPPEEQPGQKEQEVEAERPGHPYDQSRFNNRLGIIVDDVDRDARKKQVANHDYDAGESSEFHGAPFAISGDA